MPSPVLAVAALALVGAGAVLSAPAPAPSASASASASAALRGLVAPAAQAPAPRWQWPLSPQPMVRRGFDNVGRYAAGHRGVDLDASVGDAVLAPAPGVVSFAGQVAGRGVLVISHADDLRSSYEPVVATVAVGASVRTGDVVATLAAQPLHCGVVSCLHVGLRRGANYLDPLDWFRVAKAPVLLPLGRPG